MFIKILSCGLNGSKHEFKRKVYEEKVSLYKKKKNYYKSYIIHM